MFGKIKRCLVVKLSEVLPSKCPFERKILGVKIPPLCKLNPLYEDIMFYRLESYEHTKKVK